MAAAGSDQRLARRAEFNWFLHGVVPIGGIIVFIPAFLAGAGIKVPGLSFIAPLTYPLSLAGPVAAAWTVLGIVYLVVLHSREPQRIQDTGRVFLEDEAEAPVGMTAT